MRKFFSLLICPLAAGCMTPQSTGTAASDTLKADLQRADGSAAGVATLSRRSDGVWLTLSADAPVAGSFGMHIHMVGKCEGPKFTSAGGHWNPAMRQHGKDNPMGAHAGDLPNVSADANRKLSVETRVGDVMLRGAEGVLDADGAALIIHAKPDDYRTDPTGNSGDRIICGVWREG